MNFAFPSHVLDSLQTVSKLWIRQKFEWAESFGFETRNKYQILREDGTPLAYAAEQGKSFFGMLFRQLFGHWRPYDIHFFTTAREPLFVAHHPFRFFFHRLEITTPEGRTLGAIQKRFSLLSKNFDVENESGSTILKVRSPFWSPWTFSFQHLDREQAVIRKRWSGVVSEIFSDRDNFLVEFCASEMRSNERILVLAAAVFIDLLYFERKAE